MEIVFILIPISLIIIGVALWAFVWSVRNDQYEDLEKEAYGILFDENGNKNDEKKRNASK